MALAPIFNSTKQILLSLKFWIPAGLLLTSTSLFVGFRLDSKGFWGNLLAEIVGIVVGITITYILVERFVKSQRERERRNIRAFTQFSISLDILFIIHKFCITIPITGSQPLLSSIAVDISTREGAVSEKTIGLLEQYINLIQANLTHLKTQITDNQISNFYDAIEPNINNITDVLIPRIMQLSEDFNLNEIFVVFEKILVNARSEYPLFKQRVLTAEQMFLYALSVLNSSKNVLSSIAKRIRF